MRLGTDVGGDIPRTHLTQRSRCRVKALALVAVFLVCWLVLRAGTAAYGLALVGIAAFSASFLIFIRCERCHSSLYYRSGGTHAFWKLSFLWAKRCPCCELDRI